MKLYEKLQMLRKQNGYSQEQLADQLCVSRQAIGKWESNQAVPELNSLIQLSELYGVSIDRLVKDDDVCNTQLSHSADLDLQKAVEFLLKAKKNTYSAYAPETTASRLKSHDLQYEDTDFLYYDTYLGGQNFAGEEAMWYHKEPVWCMNYCGRILDDHFDSTFLKEVLNHVNEDLPYRGPSIYQKGDYSYHCKVDGTFVWYQGYEEIYYRDIKIYECYFHGGVIK